jgi:hypothetical protein
MGSVEITRRSMVRHRIKKSGSAGNRTSSFDMAIARCTCVGIMRANIARIIRCMLFLQPIMSMPVGRSRSGSNESVSLVRSPFPVYRRKRTIVLRRKRCVYLRENSWNSDIDSFDVLAMFHSLSLGETQTGLGCHRQPTLVLFVSGSTINCALSCRSRVEK